MYHKRQFKNTPKIQLKKGEIQVVKLLEHSFSNSNITFELSSDNTIIIKEEKATNNSIGTQKEIQQKQVKGICYGWFWPTSYRSQHIGKRKICRNDYRF